MSEQPSRDDLRAAFDRVPANRFLRFELLSRSADEAVVAMEILPEHAQEGGVMQGDARVARGTFTYLLSERNAGS